VRRILAAAVAWWMTSVLARRVAAELGRPRAAVKEVLVVSVRMNAPCPMAMVSIRSAVGEVETSPSGWRPSTCQPLARSISKRCCRWGRGELGVGVYLSQIRWLDSIADLDFGGQVLVPVRGELVSHGVFTHFTGRFPPGSRLWLRLAGLRLPAKRRPEIRSG